MSKCYEKSNGQTITIVDYSTRWPYNMNCTNLLTILNVAKSLNISYAFPGLKQKGFILKNITS